MIDLAGDLAIGLGLNSPEFPDGCLAIDFTLLVDVPEVFADSANIDIKQPSLQPEVEN